jgi:hypothetical protein
VRSTWAVSSIRRPSSWAICDRSALRARRTCDWATSEPKSRISGWSYWNDQFRLVDCDPRGEVPFWRTRV